jgi:intracellular sulfur oxidation DsrE/DsrF family protein
MFRFLLSPAFFLLLIQIFTVSSGQASTDNDRVQTILSQAQAPAGVVFEIASADKDALQWALPRIQQFTTSLREKFPAIEIAIVTHGREQFALQKANADRYQKVHESVKALSTKQDVPVHICQTFAAWNGVEPEEFPDYVAVSATGPQQVNDYIDLGYTLIKIKRK